MARIPVDHHALSLSRPGGGYLLRWAAEGDIPCLHVAGERTDRLRQIREVLLPSHSSLIALSFLTLFSASNTGVSLAGQTDEEEQSRLLQQIWRWEVVRAPTATAARYSTHADPAVRAATARCLGHSRDSDALPTLAAALRDVDPGVRSAAALALGQIPEGRSPLDQALATERSIPVRVQLLRSLGLTGETENIPTLLGALRGGVSSERNAAAEALGGLGYRQIDGVASQEVLQGLLEQLHRLDVVCRRPAAFALARIGAEEMENDTAAALLQATLTEPDSTTQAWLVRASAAGLGEAAWAQVAQMLVADPVSSVRIAVIRGCDRRAAGSCDEGLLSGLLHDVDEPVRHTALESITRSGVATGFSTELQALALRGTPSEQALAIPGLLELGVFPSAEAYLAPDIHPSIRAAVAESLSDVDRLLELAFHDPSTPVRTAAVTALLTLEPPLDPPSMLRLLDLPDPVLRGGVVASLAEQPDPIFQQPVLATVHSDDERDLTLAALQFFEALYTAPPEAPPPPSDVSEWMRQQCARDDVGVRQAARTACASLDLPCLALPLEPPPELPDRDALERLRSARVLTDRGEFIIEFHTGEAPLTVWMWAKLAEADFFDGLLFHRVVPDFVVQSGDPRGDGWGGPGFIIPDEFNALPYGAFSVGMAHSGPDTAGSQWFATLSPQPHLNGRYTNFGTVVQGRDVLRRIRQGDHILDVIIERAPQRSSPSDEPA